MIDIEAFYRSESELLDRRNGGYMSEPIQLDKDIDQSTFEQSGPGSVKPRTSFPRLLLIMSAGAVVLVIILLISGNGTGSFRHDPSAGEQAMRDSIFSYALAIQDFFETKGRLPSIPGDLTLSTPGIVYTTEGDSTWSLDAGDSLGYDSDMNLEEFRRGDI